MIRSEHKIAAPAAVVHAVLTDVAAWRIWSPHVDRVDAEHDVITEAGWTGRVKPWFGPATVMEVTWVAPGRGMRWRTSAAGFLLEYADLVSPEGRDSCTVTMTAELHGPAGGLVERVVAPLSALGQRRRLARLAALAEYVHSRAIVFAG